MYLEKSVCNNTYHLGNLLCVSQLAKCFILIHVVLLKLHYISMTVIITIYKRKKKLKTTKYLAQDCTTSK